MKNNTGCVFDSIWLCHKFGHKDNLCYELYTTLDTDNETLTINRNGELERLFRLHKYSITRLETGLYQCTNDCENVYVTLPQLLTQFTVTQNPFELCDAVNTSNTNYTSSPANDAPSAEKNEEDGRIKRIIKQSPDNDAFSYLVENIGYDRAVSLKRSDFPIDVSNTKESVFLDS